MVNLRGLLRKPKDDPNLDDKNYNLLLTKLHSREAQLHKKLLKGRENKKCDLKRQHDLITSKFESFIAKHYMRHVYAYIGCKHEKPRNRFDKNQSVKQENRGDGFYENIKSKGGRPSASCTHNTTRSGRSGRTNNVYTLEDKRKMNNSLSHDSRKKRIKTKGSPTVASKNSPGGPKIHPQYSENESYNFIRVKRPKIPPRTVENKKHNHEQKRTESLTKNHPTIPGYSPKTSPYLSKGPKNNPHSYHHHSNHYSNTVHHSYHNNSSIKSKSISYSAFSRRRPYEEEVPPPKSSSEYSPLFSSSDYGDYSPEFSPDYSD